MRLLVVLLVAVVVAVVLTTAGAACRQSAEEEADTGELTLCEALDAFDARLATLESLDGIVGTEQLKEAGQELRVGWDTVVATGGELEEGVSAVQGAFSDLELVLESIPDDGEFVEATASIVPQLAAMRLAFDEYYLLECPSGGPEE